MIFKYTNNVTILLYRDAYYFQIGGFDDGTWPFTKPKTYHTNLTKTNNFIQTATNRLRLRIKMKTFGICLILHQLASPVLAGQSPTAGFRWGDWSEWEPCVKVGKNHRRRRICFGPIVNKKIDKKNCEYNLGGSNIDVARCTDDDMVSNDGLSLGRMETQSRAPNGKHGKSGLNVLVTHLLRNVLDTVVFQSVVKFNPIVSVRQHLPELADGPKLTRKSSHVEMKMSKVV